MGRACNTHGDKEYMQNFGCKDQHINRSQINIKMDFKQIGQKSVDWIHMAEDLMIGTYSAILQTW
jgi:hypothetical protein